MSLHSRFLIAFFMFLVTIALCIDASVWFGSSPVSANQNLFAITILGAATCALLSLLDPPRDLG